MKYYTDNELVELVCNMGDSKESYEWIADKIAQRFEQKDRTIAFQRDRLDIAAKHMGHTLINEIMDEEDC